ncbi:WD40-repeat-containing domain protein [Dunaliella salina]|uniref:WD40-repeat-containing domain protein n=1 Tax=Dunaliella salina TaxID=3046 RepID=A0ABQ7GTX0_DUNSA|nr:WD40-repeat-containing domain protein [Dunaliella salina]|eukprot:KAF5838057.1 WD40-repeat-containing domain protein [Dunaliella salina]
MLFEKPKWVKHERQGRNVELCPLFSVDIDSTGQRLATAANDNKVRIWAMGPILDARKEEDPNVPKLLATLTDHFEPVNVARFSPKGNLIASGSDSKLVTVLEGHHGYVKGVAWDPFNMYIATQGENDGIFIWRVSDWSCVAKVKTQFSSSADNSMHTRLSWSPDGQNIVGTCMVDKSTNTYLAPIIRRTSWDSIKQFTGHKLTISVAKFNPCHFYPRKEPGSDAATTLCALGSYDTQVTLWSSSEATPVMQLTDMFKRRAVMDVAWMPDGMSMVACSVDGTIAALQFNEQDLGKKVPQHEVRSLLHSLYGDLQVRHQTPLADPELLKLQASLCDDGLSRA